jgi:hypothetical protein
MGQTPRCSSVGFGPGPRWFLLFEIDAEQVFDLIWSQLEATWGNLLQRKSHNGIRNASAVNHRTSSRGNYDVLLSVGSEVGTVFHAALLTTCGITSGFIG